jgi:GTP diphosphokinase / guanosine-3',5'-bis(diphosphate) 3'-diphosphatase
MRTEFTKLLKQIRKNNPAADLEVVRHAFRFAVGAHTGQKRNSGEPYVIHSLAVARILAALTTDMPTVAAGLLHDVLEDTAVSLPQLRAEFSEEVAFLVDGVTKISTIHMPSVSTSLEEKQANNIRKMLVATAKDVRVILIKLADRLHNLRTIEYLPEEKRTRMAKETLDIYAPLAHRLGIARWKWELEDHSFHQLHPTEYRRLAMLVAMKRRDREKWLEETVQVLQKPLQDAHVEARVIARPKHLYSIFQKMTTQGKSFDEVMDVLAVRIVTKTVTGCYNALGVVHNLWTPIPGRFKDYIAMPKANMYQSIHTTVMRENGMALEVQIRTEEMERTAREGIAAHWYYKGERRRDHKLDNNLQWLRQMYDWLQDSHAPGELIENVRRDFSVSDIYVFTPKGEVKELPHGATPLDFAYMIHTDIGHHCQGARVNGRMVPLKYNLQTGDVVEILTFKNQQPHVDWIDIVITGHARTKIRQRLREIGKLPVASAASKPEKEPAKPEPKKEVEASAPPVPAPKQISEATRHKLIRVEGAKGMAVQFGKCCNPMPGHQVLGYITKTPGITIHRLDCRGFAKMEKDPSRVIEAGWEGEGHFQTGMRITIKARPNDLADITDAMRPMNVDIRGAQYRAGKNGANYFEVVFETPERQNIERLQRKLLTISGVSQVDLVPLNKLAHLK